MRRPRRLFGFAKAIALAYVAALVAATLLQSQLLYPAPDDAVPPAPAGWTTVLLPSHGESHDLTAWYKPAAGEARASGAVILFSGNAASIASSAWALERYSTPGKALLAPTYRGYHDNPGAPSEKALKADALLAYDELKKLAGDVPVTVVGYSLGTGIAAHVAAHRAAEHLILLAPFTSVADRAAELYPIFPVRWLLRDHYEILRLVPLIEEPVTILHGTADTIIPISHGQVVAKAFERHGRTSVVFMPLADRNHGLLGVAGLPVTW